MQDQNASNQDRTSDLTIFSQRKINRLKTILTQLNPLRNMTTTQWQIGDPTYSVVAPNLCQFTAEFEDNNFVALKKKTKVNHNTVLFTFATPDVTKPLNLSTCACILAKAPLTDAENNPIVRPYTPVSTNATVGEFELLIKIYPDGKMSNYLNDLPVGEKVMFKHIKFNVKTQYPFGKKKICMLVGGTGITPMVQALHAILGNLEDKTEVKMLYGSQTQKDILGKEILDQWENNPRLSVKHVLDKEPANSDWQGDRGFITGDMVKTFFGEPEPDMKIFVCGPPGMYNAFCGPRDKPEVTGILGDLGFDASTVYKF
eukprot:augustus_masked-scaffold_4-processed-gene-17.9-mRNA-1 protein AED:0.05 eAED:0.05 QI:0/0/0/0.5/1/1/2/0/314